MILQKEYIGFGLVDGQQQHVQRCGGKSDIYLKDRWKDQLHKSIGQQKTQAGNTQHNMLLNKKQAAGKRKGKAIPDMEK